MPEVRKSIQAACARLWFSAIRLRGRQHLPASGPVLFLALHRNGLVDGFVHQAVLNAPTCLVAAHWTTGLSGLIIQGIPVVREKDAGARSGNDQALARCLAHLRRGKELVIFPEGTSDLGPRHLPFKTGAARVLAAYLEGGEPITVLPIGIHYERAWAFRSRVEVVLGPPLATELDPQLSPNRKMRTLHQRMEAALEAVGINVPDRATQDRVEALAYLATLGTNLGYFQALKAFEPGVPEAMARDWAAMDSSAEGQRALRHQGLPLIPKGPVLAYALTLGLLGPLVLGGALVNFPPLLAAVWAGRRWPDGRNVIALWRILVGVPAFLVWALVALAGSWAWLGPLGLLGYVLLTSVGILGWYRVKKLAVAVHNAVRCPGLRAPLEDLQRRVVAYTEEGARP